MKIILIALCISVSLGLQGCAANPHKQFYNDITDGKGISAYGHASPPEETRLYRGGNLEDDNVMLYEDGYMLLGEASFEGRLADSTTALQHGKDIGASLVLIYSNLTDRYRDSIPITLPVYSTSNTMYTGSIDGRPVSGVATTITNQTKTTNVPYTVEKFAQKATFWVKAKRPIPFGALMREPSASERADSGTNKGAIVDAVMKGSPAFEADVVKGDLLTEVDGMPISDKESYSLAMKQRYGKSVKMTFIRKGNMLIKEIKLNEKQY